MSFMERITSLQDVWRIAVPHIPTPAPENVAHWLNYPDDIVEAAILRTATKFSAGKANTNLDATAAYRYVTSTARNMSRATEQQ